ncbi:MAG TPA: ABC transporter ATP-binding protein [Acidimicrobiales bacterium]|jgi:branched-chain amino acid transport system ATP-binding protein|nr:ABC transporter ATP-binding protein [Acidimicrobiales bacterium]
MSALLDVRGLRVAFGGVVAVDDVSFQVDEGTLVGFIGPNGAGKTTCIEALTGYVPHATGRVVFDDHDLGGLAPHRRARLGLVRTFQSVELFDDLTVRDNLRAAANRRTWWQSLGDLVAPRWHDDESAIDDALELLGLTDVADALPAELPQGQRKLAGVARALTCRPRLLLLDEPAAGLDTVESVELGERLRAVVDRGVSVLLVDHDMGLVLGICDRVIVLDFGRVIAQGAPEEIRSNADVIAAYLGDDVAAAAPGGAS